MGSYKSQVIVCSLVITLYPRPTVEAKYKSFTFATTNIMWLESFLSELHVQLDDKSVIWCDNSSAVVVLANLVQQSKFKHVELDFFFYLRTCGCWSTDCVPSTFK